MTVVCKDCGIVKGFIEKKGTQTGLYCNKCGKWIKWLSKEEVILFNHNNVEKKLKASDFMNDYFVSQRIQHQKEREWVAYIDGYNKAIDDAVKVIENSKSIFDNSRHCSMGEKDRLQNLIKKLKAGD